MDQLEAIIDFLETIFNGDTSHVCPPQKSNIYPRSLQEARGKWTIALRDQLSAVSRSYK
jgi:hypothetical protein